MEEESISKKRVSVDSDKINICEEIITFENSNRQEKIVVQLKAAGNAPILKNNKLKLNGNYTVSKLHEFLRSQLKSAIKESDSIFIYCNNKVAPSPHYLLADLYNTYKTQNELIIYYALSEAWG